MAAILSDPLDVPTNQVRSGSFDVVVELMPVDLDESGVCGCGDVDFSADVDPVEGVESLSGWRNCSKVSPEGSTNRFLDSRKGVRRSTAYSSYFT